MTIIIIIIIYKVKSEIMKVNLPRVMVLDVLWPLTPRWGGESEALEEVTSITLAAVIFMPARYHLRQQF